MTLNDKIDITKLGLPSNLESNEIKLTNQQDSNFTFTFKDMKNFNVIVGKNGSGKSRILKAFAEKLKMNENGSVNGNFKPYGNIYDCGKLVFYDLQKHKSSPENYRLLDHNRHNMDKDQLARIYKEHHNEEYNGDSYSNKFRFEVLKIQSKEMFNANSLTIRIGTEQTEYSNILNRIHNNDKKDKDNHIANYLFGKLNIFINENENIKTLFKYNIQPNIINKTDRYGNPVHRLMLASNDTPDIEYDKLSQGEKVLLDLIYFMYALEKEEGVLTAQEKENGRQVILLLDEPDAHLHHISAKLMISALQEFAKKFNLIVVLATHNLSTIKHTEQDCLFEISNEGGSVEVKPTSKKEVMGNLTNNEDWSDAFESLIKFIPDNINNIIVVEGKYDKIIFDKAIEVKYGKEYSNLNNNKTLIISAGGDKNIKNSIEVLIKIFAEQKKYFNFYGIYDNDSDIDIVKNITKQDKYIDDLTLSDVPKEILKNNTKKAKTIVLHTGNKDVDEIFNDHDNLVVEYMFDKKLLEKALTSQQWESLDIKKKVESNDNFMYSYNKPGDGIKKKLSNYIKDNAKEEDFKYFDAIMKFINEDCQK